MSDEDDFKKMLMSCRSKELIERGMWDLNKALQEDLEICRSMNISLEKQLEDLTIQGEMSPTLLYVDLQEELNQLKKENASLIKEKLEVEKAYKIKLEISGRELNEMKQKITLKEKGFYDELQMAQMTCTYEFEKIEQKLKWELMETNKKLEEKNNIIANLRKEIENHKCHQTKYALNGDYASSFTPSGFNRMNENLEGISSNYNEMFRSDKPSNQTETYPASTSINNPLTAYESLQIRSSLAGERVQTPVLYKGKNPAPKKNGRINFSKINNASSTIPPLIPCTGSNPAVNRKRRLHDPDDLSYLIDMIDDEAE